MKKIAILSLHMGYGGIEKCIAALANILCEKYLVEIVCCYKLYETPAFYIDERVKIRYLLPDVKPNREEFKKYLKSKRILSAFKEGLKSLKILHLRKTEMVNYISNSDADVVIATRDIFDEWLGLYGKKSTLKIGWEHNHYHNNFKYARNIVRSCADLDYLILVSKALESYYKKEMRKSKCKCLFIPNVIENMPKRVAKLDEMRLVSVGRLSPEKGFLDLLKVFSLLSKKHPSWKLDIIGDGVERENLEEYIKNHNLDGNVVLHGFQDKTYIDKILQKSAVYVMTSYTESFGLVLIEAMSHGIPCVAFDSAEGARELIDSGKNGFLIKHRNFGAMKKKIEDLMKNKEVRKRLGVEARKDSKKYTSEIVGQKWLDLIEKR